MVGNESKKSGGAKRGANGGKSANQRDRDSENRSPIEKPDEPPLTKDNQPERQEAKRPPSSYAETVIGWCTVALATTAVLTVVVNWRQWRLQDRQLNLAERQFEASLVQQQPVIDIDSAKEQTDSRIRFDEATGTFYWTFYFKNIGPSTAFNNALTHTVTMYGRSETFVGNPAAPIVASDGRFATATFRATQQEYISGDPGGKLTVKFTYTDQFGRKLSNRFCRQRAPNGTSYQTC